MKNNLSVNMFEEFTEEKKIKKALSEGREAPSMIIVILTNHKTLSL